MRAQRDSLDEVRIVLCEADDEAGSSAGVRTTIPRPSSDARAALRDSPDGSYKSRSFQACPRCSSNPPHIAAASRGAHVVVVRVGRRDPPSPPTLRTERDACTVRGSSKPVEGSGPQSPVALTCFQCCRNDTEVHGSHDRVGERLRAVDFGGVLPQRDCLRFVRLGVETGDAGGHEVGRRTQDVYLTAPVHGSKGREPPQPSEAPTARFRPRVCHCMAGRATALVGGRGFLERARGGTNRRDGVRVVTHPLALEKSVAVVRRVGAVGWNITWYAICPHGPGAHRRRREPSPVRRLLRARGTRAPIAQLHEAASARPLPFRSVQGRAGSRRSATPRGARDQRYSQLSVD